MTADDLQSALLGSAMLLSRCCPKGATGPLSRRVAGGLHEFCRRKTHRSSPPGEGRRAGWTRRRPRRRLAQHLDEVG